MTTLSSRFHVAAFPLVCHGPSQAFIGPGQSETKNHIVGSAHEAMATVEIDCLLDLPVASWPANQRHLRIMTMVVWPC